MEEKIIVEFSPKFNINEKVYYLDPMFGRLKAVFIMGYVLFEQQLFYITDDSLRGQQIDLTKSINTEIFPENKMYSEAEAKEIFAELEKKIFNERFGSTFDPNIAPKQYYIVSEGKNNETKSN